MSCVLIAEIDMYIDVVDIKQFTNDNKFSIS